MITLKFLLVIVFLRVDRSFARSNYSAYFVDEFELANSTNALCHQPVRKKLTTEALFMLFVILLFVILTLIRSAVGVYESCKTSGKETHSSISERKEKAADGATYAEEEKKLFETSIYADFLTNLKKILDCFCIKSNARRILNTVSTQEQFSSLHGIRAITVIWTLIGHCGMFYGGAVTDITVAFTSFVPRCVICNSAPLRSLGISRLRISSTGTPTFNLGLSEGAPDNSKILKSSTEYDVPC
ncbi:hypothetical protein AVEN_99359-1 [Araneus ventricosus]|uniref:Uncharacterized protein n=1 Tax=Araneus ventricosus TaxID=182803 RepID=A0A4Y2M5K7_ARAVE|nr:hypothetical protein AVEN_99359-1 [Araneus ventricosus]